MPDRPPPPELEFTTPDCPICLKPTDFNEGFDCNNCGAHWAEHGNDVGEWDDQKAVQCTGAVAPWRGSTDFPKLAADEFRCFLAEGHEPKEHTNPEYYSDWLDTDKNAFRVKLAATTPAVPGE